MNMHHPESTPVELDLDELAQVAGGLPRGGWETDPPPPPPEEVKADTTPAAPAA